MLLAFMAIFTLTTYAQEEKKVEKKAIKVKVIADDDGNVTIDTSFVVDEDFDGDLKALIDDEEILKKLEDLKINVDVEVDDEGNVFVVKTDGDKKDKYYYTIVTDDEGNTKIEVDESNLTNEVFVKKMDGDSTITIMIKSKDGVKKENGKVMIWHSDGDEEKLEEVFIKGSDGDDKKIIILTEEIDGENVKVVKEKGVTLIYLDESDLKVDKKEKEKKQEKKKKDK
jgi:hypothetical protein